MFKKKTWVIPTALFLLGTVATFVLENLFELKQNINIKLGVLICVLVTLISIIGYFGYITYSTIQKIRVENKTLQSQVSKDNDIF